jgi:hypothetical protein
MKDQVEKKNKLSGKIKQSKYYANSYSVSQVTHNERLMCFIFLI